MRLITLALTMILTLTTQASHGAQTVRGDLYSKKFSAHSSYVINQSLGKINISTKARAFFVPIKDNRSFVLDPDFLLSDVLKDMEPGTSYSLDINSDWPRYEATLKSVDIEKELATVKISDKKAVIDLFLVLDLSGEVVDLKHAKITLLRVGGITLDVNK